MALVAVTLRGLCLAQMVVALPKGLTDSTRPAVFTVTWLAAAGVSGWLIVDALRLRTLMQGAWRIPDLALGLGAMPLLAWALPDAERVGSWSAWTGAYSVSVVTIAAAWLGIRTAVGYAAVVTAAYLGVASTGRAGVDDSVLADALSFLGFACISALFARYFRSLASQADAAKAAEVAAIRELELERYRITVHDATGVLRLLGDERTPPEVRPALQRQALTEATRLRTYLSDGVGSTYARSPGRATIATVLDEALSGFSDLPLDISVDLGAHVRLPEEHALALGRAVTTVLHNVRRHAQAESVIVHADSDDTGWEVLVRDDGVGFDAASEPLGFGLAVQVIQSLAVHGIHTTIEAEPGAGACVTMRGRITGQNSQEAP
jgi:signal transduction histidine kinase